MIEPIGVFSFHLLDSIAEFAQVGSRLNQNTFIDAYAQCCVDRSVITDLISITVPTFHTDIVDIMSFIKDDDSVAFDLTRYHPRYFRIDHIPVMKIERRDAMMKEPLTGSYKQRYRPWKLYDEQDNMDTSS